MCELCDGATIEELREELAERIEWFGWGGQYVEGDPEANDPWAYTIGLVERWNHPELVVASLSYERSAALLDMVVDEIQAGRRFEAGVTATVNGVDLSFAAVHPRQFERNVFARWFDYYEWAYGSGGPELSALQVSLPDRCFCPHHAVHRPRLDLPGDALNRSPANRATRRARQRARRRPGKPPRRRP